MGRNKPFNGRGVDQDEDYNDWPRYTKAVFHLVTVNHVGRFIKKKQLKRKQVLAYTAKLERSIIVMEACGGANYWAREFMAQGHQVKLIAPQYVKPYLKGNKNDYNDAEAIAEASQRPNMRFMPIKAVEQQDIQNFHRQRERLKGERTALVNQIRIAWVVMAKGEHYRPAVAA